MGVPQPLDLGKDVHVIKLAREVAIDHYPLSQILDRYQISDEDWEALQEWPRFQELLSHERQQWHGSLNTNHRVRLKSATLIEEWMEEADNHLHDSSGSLGQKIELIKLLGKFALLDAPAPMEAAASSGRVTININMGASQVDYEAQEDMIDITPQESDPDAIDFDWEEEFTAAPMAGSEAIFEDTFEDT
jgi:hypothetical protein